MAEQENLQLVQQNYAAFGSGDMPTFFSNLADDVVWVSNYPANIPFAGEWRGHEGVGQFFTLIGETLEVLEFGIQEFIAQGDTVVIVGSEKVKVKSTGSEYRNEWIHVWKLKDGKAAKIKSYNDTASVVAAFQGA